VASAPGRGLGGGAGVVAGGEEGGAVVGAGNEEATDDDGVPCGSACFEGEAVHAASTTRRRATSGNLHGLRTATHPR